MASRSEVPEAAAVVCPAGEAFCGVAQPPIPNHNASGAASVQRRRLRSIGDMRFFDHWRHSDASLLRRELTAPWGGLVLSITTPAARRRSERGEEQRCPKPPGTTRRPKLRYPMWVNPPAAWLARLVALALAALVAATPVIPPRAAQALASASSPVTEVLGRDGNVRPSFPTQAAPAAPIVAAAKIVLGSTLVFSEALSAFALPLLDAARSTPHAIWPQARAGRDVILLKRSRLI
jgi:hypothetical protein